MTTKNVTVGQTVYFIDDNNIPQKTEVKNIENDYINFCECDSCKARKGTDTEYYKFDKAIPVNYLFFSVQEVREHLQNKLEQQIYSIS